MARFLSLRGAVLALAGIGLVTLSAVGVVADDQQAVVLRMGKPDRMVNHFAPGPVAASHGAGLIAHVPVLERVVRLDRGLVGLAVPALAVRSSDQQAFNLDLSGKYRIIDPVRAVRTAGDQDGLNAQLAALLPALARAEFARIDAAHVALPGGGGAWARLRAALDARARVYGVQVVDLRVQRVTLPEAAQQAALARMKDEREALALSTGDEGVQQAMQIRSEAEVEAARIIGASASRDPEFYDFYRAMNSYETMLADPTRRDRATLILSADSAYLKQMNGRPPGR